MTKPKGDSMKKVNVGINPETHTQAKIISVLKDINLTEYLKQAIEAAVEKDKKIIKELKKKGHI